MPQNVKLTLRIVRAFFVTAVAWIASFSFAPVRRSAKLGEPSIDQLWREMKSAQQDWDLTIGQLEAALASSDSMPSPDGELALQEARTRESQASSQYAAKVHAYAAAVLGKK
jgi:hypothetical protein